MRRTIEGPDDLTVRSASRSPVPAAPGIQAADISLMVDRFYDAIRRDERLGPLFDGVIEDRWPAHLNRMKAFWRSVLLRTGEYHGRPVPAHNGIADLRSSDFERWIALFDATTNEIFEPQAAIVIQSAARRVGSSLWLARFGSPFNSPPEALQGGGAYRG
ncbi:group III truncated hemoglobin [Notoacmeibacter sp. MSK16QG-6]|uniref:group III truncated hemoglobin n=1 Tax=Notoacmeibacter sp. MSK16QG-6 TaxID=2957982 RepID=UPI00209F4826|nr:group III truncated hemoglobin [Notoacmeibacter sp. MSK16QG-6]MCP1199644.1 group III truncated hemoglobin [Notoacmeibacter sp. MSK16QG-6]